MRELLALLKHGDQARRRAKNDLAVLADAIATRVGSTFVVVRVEAAATGTKTRSR